ncbi:MAG TPA: MBL fold metallo-hydrolase [Thermoanaerobaculia bacterium]|jgi:glyoxylase-like metal-dependent hydrolase (beta-lactamase superfamily II)|nr:MBL fold metallo-hydrolase [Thermoanaerobaculia bacterium]
MLLAAILAATLADPLTSSQRAVRALEKSLEAHGSPDPKVTLTIRSDLANEGQSVKGLGPFEAYPMEMAVVMDPPKRLRVVSRQSIAGDFTFSDVLAVQDGKGFSLTPEMKTWSEVTAEPPILNRYIPQRTIRQLLRNRSSLRALDEHTILSGPQTFHLDPKTNLLQRVEQVMSTTYGDALRETFYEDYRRTAGILLPSRMRVRTTNSVHGTFENVYRYEDVKAEASFGEKDFVVPEGYTKADYSYRAQFAAKPLAPDVWLLENVSRTTGQWSYNVLVVALDDGVLLAEAPLDSATTERIFDKVRELLPGKPIRYLVQSHHHGDHLGGIRPYIADGVTILTGATAKPLIEKIAAAPYVLDPDRQFRNPKTPNIETVKEPRKIGDKVVVYNIGPNPHAEDMLLVHLPAAKVLWQSDMINEGEYPENAATRSFREHMARLGLAYDTVVGLHGKIVRLP